MKIALQQMKSPAVDRKWNKIFHEGLLLRSTGDKQGAFFSVALPAEGIKIV